MSRNTEELVEKIGSFGWYQKRLFLLTSFMTFISTNILMVMTFSTAEPPWRCVGNTTTCSMNGTFTPKHDHYEHRCTIPRRDWEYAVDGDFSSIVTEWDLVCDKSAYVSHANSLVFVFWMIGGIGSSILSDKVGRKKIAFPCYIIVAISGFASAFANSFWLFAAFRSLMGIGLSGCGTTIFVLVMEFIGSKHRSSVGNGIWFAYIVAMWFLALIAFLLPSWRLLTIISSAPGLFGFTFWWFTPESLRWLLMKGKSEEAKRSLQKAARINGKELTDEELKITDVKYQNVQLGSVKILFATKTMIHRTFATWYCWLVAAMVYYGLILSTPSIGGNMYLNFFISAVCELVGMVICVISLDKFGRRLSIATSFWISGVAMVIASVLNFYDDGTDGFLAGKILMTMIIGKFFMTIAFNGIYVHTSELFPTIIRNTALGTSSSIARIGSATSPYIVYSQRIHPLVPFGIMALNALVSGIVFLGLPETLNQPMPDFSQPTNQIRDDTITKENGSTKAESKL